jgi:hypothetical protein
MSLPKSLSTLELNEIIMGFPNIAYDSADTTHLALTGKSPPQQQQMWNNSMLQ